jgi:hypothetical protein
MNWTTTTVPLWQIDCDNYRKVGRHFELRDVTTAEHRQFVEVFAARYDLAVQLNGAVATFRPPASL